MAENGQEAQDKSIKDRKKQLYEVQPKVVAKGSGKSFTDFLRETPAAPLSGGMKAALWGVGLLVVLLLVAALLKSPKGPKKPGKIAMIVPVQVGGLLSPTA